MTVQQLSPAPKKTRDMAEAIPRRPRMAICRNAGCFISGDVVGKGKACFRWLSFANSFGLYEESSFLVPDVFPIIDLAAKGLVKCLMELCRSGPRPYSLRTKQTNGKQKPLLQSIRMQTKWKPVCWSVELSTWTATQLSFGFELGACVTGKFGSRYSILPSD